jgi:predicted O-methyltransferase YrrM
MFRPPAWATGGISTADAEFLLELVAREAPELVVEIGVAAGTSSAALLYALDQLPGAPDRVLYSVDVRSTCYFDPRYATGAAADLMYPQPRAQWRRRIPSDARRITAELTPGSIDLIFVDGNHAHPWPLLDVLHLAPYARPGAWIALHDLALPRLYPQFQTYGPAWLFAAWPGAGIVGTGAAENIGAVRLPADLRHLIPLALELLQACAWEAQPTAADVQLSPVFAPVTAALRPRLRR